MSRILNAIRSSESEVKPSDDPIANNILDSLRKTRWKLSRIERLSGSHGNFIYRGWLKRPDKDSYDTIVIKHAEPYAAFDNSLKLDVERSVYERMMIESLADKNTTKYDRFIVRTPRFLSADHYPNTILMEDLPGSLTVKEYLYRYGETMLPATARELGITLGKWLKEYHLWLNGNDEKAMLLKQRIKGNTSMISSREQMYIGSYRNAMKQFPTVTWPGSRHLDQIEDDIKKISREGASGIHGDFWTGNMILKDKPLASQDGKTLYPTKILILDFEASQPGSRPQDLAQCLAELYMEHHFYGASAPLQIMQGLIHGYFSPTEIPDKYDRTKSTVDPASIWSEKDRLNFALNTAMHFGIHLVVVPNRAGWPKGEKMVACARLGNDYLLNGHNADCPRFKNGPLHDLFPSFPPPPKVNRMEVVKRQKKKSKLKALFCGCFGE
ncbi:uncharacterized protein PV09_06176 [Verruconis gallopava]|uniref:Aminoglycoside phosphotransferase domain-containing protein n=1 Tax=Verruconis gallopava TaxID=253628 RepID=A0A0D2AT77_9PEZI|nr:uncharacterized protein PV09_06176 [Verruconis gallopava]KIW02354.1 hypothetical protein PV09_06176 [Verruconis gallopava]